MATRTALSEFISRIKTDNVARLNRFVVEMENPATIFNHELVQLYCEQATLPSITFASQPTRSYGEQREVVYDRNFETLSLTFLVDRQFKVKEFFDLWANRIIDPETRLHGYYRTYAADMKITTYDTKENATYQTSVFEAYPKTIGALSLDHNSKDVAKLQVTFNYKYHKNKKLDSPVNDKQPKNIFGFNLPDPYKLTSQAGAYLRDTVSNAFTVPDLYYDNFSQYQEGVNTRAAASQIERQSQETGYGAPPTVY
jgi:hypothetical protein